MRFIVTKTTLLLVILLLALAITTPALAAEISTNGTLPAGQTVDDDLLVSAQAVQIDGSVKGNLVASGQTITINGDVFGDAILAGETIIIGKDAVIEGNLIAAGSTIEIAGDVNGTLFGASAAMHLQPGANIRRNAITAGYSFISEADSQIEWDLLTADYQAILNGSVGRDAIISAGAIEIYAGIGRDAKLTIGDSTSDGNDPNQSLKDVPFFQQPGIPKAVQPGLRIAPGASIGGSVQYTASAEQSAGIQAKPLGGIVYSTPTPGEQPTGKTTNKPKNDSFFSKVLVWLWDTMQNTITLLILGALAAWLLPNWMDKVAGILQAKPGESFGKGFLALIIGYAGGFFAFGIILILGLIISLASLGGLSSAIFGLGFSSLALFFCIFQFLVSYGSKVVVAWWAGQFITKAVAPASTQNKWVVGLVGTIAYVIPASLPFIGWVFGFAATLAGLGALYLLGRQWHADRKAAA